VTTVPRISYARSADGVRLAFTTAGQGPALVFVPWVPFSNISMEWQSASLSGVFERLARRLTVIHYDGRGTGHSQRDVTDLSLEAMVADLLAVVDQVGATEVNLRRRSISWASTTPARTPSPSLRAIRSGSSGWRCSAGRRAAGTP
jgi:pimeloyl-ACP methyl ester carboxylesterase